MYLVLATFLFIILQSLSVSSCNAYVLFSYDSDEVVERCPRYDDKTAPCGVLSLPSVGKNIFLPIISHISSFFFALDKYYIIMINYFQFLSSFFYSSFLKLCD